MLNFLSSVVVPPAHWVFNYGFSMVKPVMGPRTIGKVQVFGCDRKKWERVLLQNIPPEAVPAEYGGTGPHVLNE